MIKNLKEGNLRKVGEIPARGKKGKQGQVDIFRQELKPTSKYVPHQGKREMSRRLRGA